MHMKFETENPNQTPETKLSPESEKSNMATRRPFLKWRQCKSTDVYPYTQRLCYWTLELIFKAKLKVESGNQNILNGHQAAILEVTSLKINRLQSTYVWNLKLKFHSKLHLCSVNHVGRMDRLTDGWGESGIPPYNFNTRIGVVPTTSLFSTLHLASTDCIKTTARRDERHLSFGIRSTLYQIEWVSNFNGLLGTADTGVHVVHTSCVIMAYTLETLSSLT